MAQTSTEEGPYSTLRWAAHSLSNVGNLLMLGGGLCLLGFIATLLLSVSSAAIPWPWPAVIIAALVLTGIICFAIGLSLTASSERIMLEIANADHIASLRQTVDELNKDMQSVKQLDLHLRSISSATGRTAAAVEALAANVKKAQAL